MNATDHAMLIAIWEASSDYLLALDFPDFADENGGVDHLLSCMSEAVEGYELNSTMERSQ